LKTKYAAHKAEADRARDPSFPSFNVIAGGPGSLAERSTTGGEARKMVSVHIIVLSLERQALGPYVREAVIK
jgi:hypothetical protein